MSHWIVPFSDAEYRKHEFTAMVHEEKILDALDKAFDESIEQAITADRFQLQREISKLVLAVYNKQWRQAYENEPINVGLVYALGDQIKSIFSQSPPAESKHAFKAQSYEPMGKPFRAGYCRDCDKPADDEIHAESEPEEKHYCGCAFYQGHVITLCSTHGRQEVEKRVLAEREACVNFLEAQVNGFETMLEHSSFHSQSHSDSLRNTIHSLRETMKQIRFRSNPEQGSEPEERPETMLDYLFRIRKEAREEAERNAKEEKSQYADHLFLPRSSGMKCRRCDLPESQHAKSLPFPGDLDRIPLLQQIIGEQAEMITKLQEENHALQSQISAGEHVCVMRCPACRSHVYHESPTNRKT